MSFLPRPPSIFDDDFDEQGIGGFVDKGGGRGSGGKGGGRGSGGRGGRGRGGNDGTLGYKVFENNTQGRADAKRFLRLSQARIGRLSGEDYNNIWVYITSQTAFYTDAEITAVLASVTTFFTLMRNEFPSLPIPDSALPLFEGNPVNRESIVQIFYSLKDMLGM